MYLQCITLGFSEEICRPLNPRHEDLAEIILSTIPHKDEGYLINSQTHS